MLDLAQEIVPARGLGGFEVGKPLSDYVETLRLDHSVVKARTHGLWQIVYSIPQIYSGTDEEWHEHHDRMDAWMAARLRGEDADLGEVNDALRRPETEPAIEVWVDVRDGIIDAVAALPRYEGAFRNLRAGMTLAESRAAEPALVESLFLDQTTVSGVRGLVLIFDPSDPDFAERPDDVALAEIKVFDPSRSDEGIKPY